jgi:hypothetical protein
MSWFVVVSAAAAVAVVVVVVVIVVVVVVVAGVGVGVVGVVVVILCWLHLQVPSDTHEFPWPCLTLIVSPVRTCSSISKMFSPKPRNDPTPRSARFRSRSVLILQVMMYKISFN